MARTTRADEAGGAYHALNRGNARQRIFRKEADYEAFARILADGLARCGKINGVRKIKGPTLCLKIHYNQIDLTQTWPL